MKHVLCLAVILLFCGVFDASAPAQMEKPEFVFRNEIGKSILAIERAEFENSEGRFGNVLVEVRSAPMSKPIRALGISVTFELSDNTYTSATLGMDSFIHPDVAKLRSMKPLLPKTLKTFTSNDINFLRPGITVEKMIVQVEYIEFADGSYVAEPDSQFKKKLDGVRKGAFLFGNWIKEHYRKNRDTEKIVTLLSGNEYPEEVKGNDTYIPGAEIYRTCLLNAYRKDGLRTLVGILEKES